MGELLGGWKRSAMCGTYRKENVGESVTVMGWTHRRRDLGNLIFVWLRDRTGIIQVVFDASDNAELFEKAQQIKSEYVLAVKGNIILRTPENINPSLETGEIEVRATELKILSESETPPFSQDDENVTEATRLKYRYLDLRRLDKQRVMIMKSKVSKAVREFLDAEGFIDLETPILTLSTPEGARDYLVPSRVFPGHFFALPQSPQLFKQLLMVAGFDRYYQIAKCFRDEDLRADRQPEFTQIDIEMSFVDEEDVYDVTERMFKKIFKDVLDIDLQVPFVRVPYAEAMERFGSDKPDTRFGMEIINADSIASRSAFKVFSDTVANGGTVRALCAKGAAKAFTRKELDALTEHVRTYKAKGMAYLLLDPDGTRGSFMKFVDDAFLADVRELCGAETGDAIFFIADQKPVALTAIGQLRLELGRRLDLIDSSKFNFLWVTQFPMLEWNEDEGRYQAAHHPFCSPVDEDIPLMETHPELVRAKSYDIVLNGTELASGSIRIHSRELQERVFKMIGFTREQAEARFGFLMNAFKYGPPPHGGIAPGLDRIVMLMAGCNSIRDTIPFPKVQSSACLMTEAPGTVDPKQLAELGLEIIHTDN